MRVADRLGRDIVGGRPDVDEVLPREADLALTYRVGRSAVREALKTLAAKGLIESRPRRGTVVRAHRYWNLFDADVQRWLLETPVDTPLLEDLAQLVRLLLPHAAELSARRVGSRMARDGLDLLPPAPDPDPALGRRWRQDLCTAILNLTGNRYFGAMIPALATFVARHEGDDAELPGVLAALSAGDDGLARSRVEAWLASSAGGEPHA